jgi:mRNA-degrading endonuclease RelE of RelBE toxin-antitoxin system
MSGYQWHLRFTEAARQQVSQLPSRDRMAVFDAIADLCLADNPYRTVHTMKLREKRFKGLYRRRQGDYRILFEAQPGSIEYQKHVYKGSLWVVQILSRKDAYD